MKKQDKKTIAPASIRLTSETKEELIRIAAQRGVSQGQLIKELLQKEIEHQDPHMVLVHVIDKITEAIKEMENWYYGKDEPEDIQALKNRLYLAINVVIDTTEIIHDPRSFTEIDGEKVLRFPFSAWCREFENIVWLLKE